MNNEIPVSEDMPVELKNAIGYLNKRGIGLDYEYVPTSIDNSNIPIDFSDFDDEESVYALDEASVNAEINKDDLSNLFGDIE